jgi:hypothetical protein
LARCTGYCASRRTLGTVAALQFRHSMILRPWVLSARSSWRSALIRGAYGRAHWIVQKQGGWTGG